jgi:signal transduction histidine kinase
MAVEGTARPVPAAVDLIADRVIQESLTNVRKHAGTPMATVRLRLRAGHTVHRGRGRGKRIIHSG